MKKLCTYLTLLVLAFLGLAQPAVAAPDYIHLPNSTGGEWTYNDSPVMTKDGNTMSYYFGSKNNKRFFFISDTWKSNWNSYTADNANCLYAVDGDHYTDGGNRVLTAGNYTLVKYGTFKRCFELGSGADYVLTMDFSTTNPSLNIYATNQIPNKLYLVNNQNNDNWQVSNAPEFSKDGSTFTTTVNVTNGNYKFFIVRDRRSSLDKIKEDNVGVCFQASGLNNDGDDNTISTFPYNGTMYLYGSNKSCFKITQNGTYTITVTYNTSSQSASLRITQDALPPTGPSAVPSNLYLIGGKINGSSWSATDAINLVYNSSSKTFEAKNVKFQNADGADKCYFSFITNNGNSWDSEDRYGAPSKDKLISAGTDQKEVTYFKKNVDAKGSNAWMIDAGTYDVKVDFSDLENIKLIITKSVLEDEGGSKDVSSDHTSLYITGSAIEGWPENDNDYGKFNEMEYDPTTKTWSYTTSVDGAFKIVDKKGWDQARHANEYGFKSGTTVIPSSEPSAANFEYKGAPTSDINISGYPKTIYIKEVSGGYKIWYNDSKDVYIFTPKVEKDMKTPARMILGKDGIYRYGPMKKGEYFLMSRTYTNWGSDNNIYAPTGTSTDAKKVTVGKPSSANVGRKGQGSGNNFYLDVDGCIMFDPATLKVWIEPEHEWTWDDFSDEVYLRGMLVAGKWHADNDEYSTCTYIMERTAQPGLWSFPISKGNVTVRTVANMTPHEVEKTYYKTSYTQSGSGVDTEERYHFMFSTSGYNNFTQNGSGFWNNAFRPYDGMAILEVNAEKKAFVAAANYSQNYFSLDEGTLYVDLINHLAWIEADNVSYSDEQIRFYFWDKGGNKTEYNQFKWWNSESNRTVTIENADTGAKQNLTTYNSELGNSVREYDKNEQDVGFRYTIAEQIAENVKNAGGRYWIIISKNNSTSEQIRRPYVRNAVYTQPYQPESGEPTQNIPMFTAGDLEFTLDPYVRVIESNVEATRVNGGVTEDQTLVYPYVNQYVTNLVVSNLPVPVGEAAYSYFDVDHRFTIDTEGQTPKVASDHAHTTAEITGLNFLNPSATDVVTVNFSYVSKDLTMSFNRTRSHKVATYLSNGNNFAGRDLTAIKARLEMPTMYPGEINFNNHNYELMSEAFAGLPNYMGADGEIHTEDHAVVDVVLHQEFEPFRDNMIDGRAAYIGYNITGLTVGGKAITDNKCDMGYELLDTELQVVKNGRPMTWDYTTDTSSGITPDTELINHDENYWFYQAFHDRKLDIQLAHVACGKNFNELLDGNKTIKIDINYEMIVPIATSRSIELNKLYAPAPDSRQNAKRKIGELEEEQSQPTYVPNVDTTVDTYEGRLTAPRDEETYELNQTAEIVLSGNVVTGIENISVNESANDGEVLYFNLQGVQVNGENLTPGFYIRRHGSTSEKVYIR